VEFAKCKRGGKENTFCLVQICQRVSFLLLEASCGFLLAPHHWVLDEVEFPLVTTLVISETSSTNQRKSHRQRYHKKQNGQKDTVYADLKADKKEEKKSNHIRISLSTRQRWTHIVYGHSRGDGRPSRKECGRGSQCVAFKRRGSGEAKPSRTFRKKTKKTLQMKTHPKILGRTGTGQSSRRTRGNLWSKR